MKNVYYNLACKALIAGVILFSSDTVKAGNPDRAGQAGATEILINPWAQSSGWGAVDVGGVKGVEAIFGNVAGTAFTKKTEVGFSHSMWLKGSDMSINVLGFTQRVGEGSVMGFSLMSFSFGDIPVTTVDQPEGGLGEFTPQFYNISLSYAKAFSSSIYGGLNLKIISESISNVGAQGVAIDAGIQYITGTNADKNNMKIGITLKNVGTPMKFGGDGLSTRVLSSTTPTYEYTVEQRSYGFEIPSLVKIGIMYDIDLAADHRLSPALSFTSNSFTSDQFTGGLQYAFKENFMLRGGFTYEENIFDDELRATVFTGPSAGVTVQLPLGKTGKLFGMDYSYRATNPFDGTHSFGLRFTL